MPTLPTVPDFKITSSGSNSSFSHGSAYGGYGPAILGVTWTEGALTTIIVALRAWTALRVLGSPGWDLVWVVFAWVSCTFASLLIHHPYNDKGVDGSGTSHRNPSPEG